MFAFNVLGMKFPSRMQKVLLETGLIHINRQKQHEQKPCFVVEELA
jgi:hypothetical protein